MIRPRIQTSSRLDRASSNTIDRAFQSILGIIIIGVVYRYCWIDITDPYKCGALLNKGEWLDPGPRWSSRKPFQNWQPDGCLMHEYQKKDIQECLGQQRIVFAGDSTTRQIYWAVAKKMDAERAQDEISDMLDSTLKHKDLQFTSDGVTVEFIWDPWLNSTRLDTELQRFQANPPLDGSDAANSTAGLLLLGAPGLWYARHGQENFSKDFRAAIDHVIPYMDHAPEDQSAVPDPSPFLSRDSSPNLLLLAPIQVPKYESLSPSREKTITPEKIDQMNNYLQQASAHSKADVVWSYSLMTWNTVGVYEESGLHVVDNVAGRKADILLNLRCNADSAAKGYPFDRTCCTNYTQPGRIQWLMIVVGMIALPGLYLSRRKQFARIGGFLPSPETMRALMIFALVLCYCFYADRTQIFEKSQKQFRRREFLMACLAVLAVGILSIRKSRSSVEMEKGATPAEDSGFLSRDQTDEWKGWMQLFILIYHYTYGSRTLWIYEVVRVLVASYLFMTGFGHTLYFLRKDDYSLKRVAKVLVRLNLLSCALPYMMRTDYMFYYFAPLVSFWFCVIYATLRIKHSKNSRVAFVLGKVILSAAVTTCFTTVPQITNSVSTLLAYTCGISWSMPEWRFRTFLDLYIVYVGMIVAILFNRTTRLKSGISPTGIMDKLLALTIAYQRLFRVIVVIISMVLPPIWWALARVHTKKEDFNRWHPIVSCLPIVSFVALRNSNRFFRNYSSRVFAWFGRCSLETYVLQYHIWLAGDTKGLLRLGLWDRWFEAAILTMVFVWISWVMSGVTHTLTEWIVTVPGEGVEQSRVSLNYKSQRSPYLSPLMLQNGNQTPATPSKDIRFEIGGPRWLEKWMLALRDDLKWRMGFLLMILWLGNMVYT